MKNDEEGESEWQPLTSNLELPLGPVVARFRQIVKPIVDAGGQMEVDGGAVPGFVGQAPAGDTLDPFQSSGLDPMNSSRLMGLIARGVCPVLTDVDATDTHFDSHHAAMGASALDTINDHFINYASANRPTECSIGRVSVNTAAHDEALNSLLQLPLAHVGCSQSSLQSMFYVGPRSAELDHMLGLRLRLRHRLRLGLRFKLC